MITVTHPLISIAMCTYNGGKYLRKQLDSLLNQSYPNLEISIYDDCSTDNTMEILEEYSTEYSQIRIHRNKQNLGYQRNFEANLKSCRGEFIAPCDQDDIWELDKIEKLFKLSEDNILVYHDSELVDENDAPIGYRMTTKLNFVSGKKPEAFLFFNCVSGHAMLFRKSLLEHIFPFPTKGFYDHWIVYVASHFGRIDYLNECLVKYRQHTKNLTDIRGVKRNETKLQTTISRIERENDWLNVCAEYEAKEKRSSYATWLLSKGQNRASNFFNFGFGYEIWKNRNALLHIPKQDEKKKFSFALRQVWGLKTKTIFK
ncbi:glycosyltransferase involved in cell wall biosynthesis [Algoriphagus ratkowskyi]|uniref:Glycosyltransferase family 2 protein n=1 Tax=Algoriphagus ratkowskyi TaxID=57028 RepID=A0A2W7S1N6_9BACT|nr:glycosyltransferase family 2 protein [Algoriphagus ratkowskyi]PZX57055.1 glycosyltransferase involved in cell wall biosynthesis [Algoriphagus ratkowskyi]TXD79952.1 glycosyltransferase family 2 protein [Algoriphagus ratkowskyi]